MSNELQKDEYYLPGDLGTIKVGDAVRKVKSVFKGNDGAVTLTIAEHQQPLEINGRKTGLGIIFPEKTIELK